MLSDTIAAAPRTGSTRPAQALFEGQRFLTVPVDWRPTLLVVIDTEEEFDWTAPPNPASRAVTNVQSIPVLQSIFDRYGVRPAYLIDYPVASAPEAATLLRSIADSGRCEIGAHLHPWVTPPIEEQVHPWHAFACNLPGGLEQRKIEALTRAIESAFGAAPIIFKAGAYGIGPRTPGILADLGYRIDTSLVPFTDFTAIGGPNFRSWTGQPFETPEGIIEMPLSAGFSGRFSRHGPRLFPRLERPIGRTLHLPGIAARLALLERLRLSPEGHALADMIRLTDAALARRERLFMLTLHSSTLLPGSTHYVRTPAERTAFLQRIEDFLRYFHETIGGRSAKLSETAMTLSARRRAP